LPLYSSEKKYKSSDRLDVILHPSKIYYFCPEYECIEQLKPLGASN